MKKQSLLFKGALAFGALVVLGLGIVASFKQSVTRTAPATSLAPVPALTITPPVAAGKRRFV